ncbi:MAG TPA: hypothetical protein VFO47_11600 [Actinomycetes bacterium]|nr:hypothetical protein [Actinomycetes bacterium]HEX5878361.1 hypothetical protein [Actinomycetota bacterium]
MDVIACPDPTCQAPAWVYDRWTWPSTDGPVEHVKTGCEADHHFTPMAASLVPFRGPTPVTTRRPAEVVR